MDFNFKAKNSDKGKRLESFLYERLGNWSHQRIKHAIDGRCVFVNGKNVFIASWGIKPSDRVMFKPRREDFPQNNPQGLKKKSGKTTSKYHFIKILFEDEYILAADKPAQVDYDSYVDEVNAYLKRTHLPDFYPYLGQMHRLDKDTSGVLLFTKKKIANMLSKQFRERKIRKTYLALVVGRLDQENGVIVKRIEKIKLSQGRKGRIVDEDAGKETRTEFSVLERYDDATLVKINLKTGRTHQIRIHFQDLGYPLVGDEIYSDPNNKPKVSLKRHALHAWEIEFTHPITNNKLKIVSPIPPDLENLIDSLRAGV